MGALRATLGNGNVAAPHMMVDMSRRPSPLFLAVLVLSAAVAAMTAYAEDTALPHASDVTVEVNGAVPEFADPQQVAAFLADKMAGAAPSWHFVAPEPGAAPPKNRVVWQFKTLKIKWGGGAHNGFPQPVASRSYLNAEVRLYLNDQYQLTMLSQSTLISGHNGADLAAMAAKVTQSLAAAAASDKP